MLPKSSSPSLRSPSRLVHRLLLLLPIALAACDPVESPVEPEVTEAQGVAKPETQDELEFVGIVTSGKSEVVPAAFTARVTSVPAFNGKRVKKGEAIASLDEFEMRAKIKNLRALEQAASARSGMGGAMAAAAAVKLRATERLVAVGAAAPIQIATTRAEMNQGLAQAGGDAAQGLASKADRENLEQQLSKSTMTAPIDGVLMQLKATDGQVVQQGTAVARVFDTSDLWIKFALPKEYRNRVAHGDRVQLRVEGNDKPIWATVERISVEEPQISFVIVDANIDDSKLAPDQVRVASVGRVRLEKKGKK